MMVRSVFLCPYGIDTSLGSGRCSVRNVSKFSGVVCNLGILSVASGDKGGLMKCEVRSNIR